MSVLCSAGDLVTLTIQQDVHKAVSELIESAERRQGGAHSPRLPQGQLPPLLLTLQPVDSPVGPCSIATTSLQQDRSRKCQHEKEESGWRPKCTVPACRRGTCHPSF